MNNALPQRRKLISIECGTQEKVRNIAKITPSSSNLGLLENKNISNLVWKERKMIMLKGAAKEDSRQR